MWGQWYEDLGLGYEDLVLRYEDFAVGYEDLGLGYEDLGLGFEDLGPINGLVWPGLAWCGLVWGRPPRPLLAYARSSLLLHTPKPRVGGQG